MKSAVIIPARYASTRLPGKPLLKETGKYLIQHVYEQAYHSSADEVIVATDDHRIVVAVEEFGGRAVLTRSDHPSGTDRIAEAAASLAAQIVVNLQGDEPLVDPAHLNLLLTAMQSAADPKLVTTLALPIKSKEEWLDSNCVKVACTAHGNALYFSRSPIPFVRDGQPDFNSSRAAFLHHLGIYAYHREFLLRLAAAPPDRLEQLEKLEQLRVFALGGRIQVDVVESSFGGVDTPEDYQRFVSVYRQRHSVRAA